MHFSARRKRSLPALIFVALVAIPASLPAVFGSPPGPEGPASPRVTDNANDLIVGPGETYMMSGCHTYDRSVQINGTLKVTPYDGENETTGTLVLSAPWMIIG